MRLVRRILTAHIVHGVQVVHPAVLLTVGLTVGACQARGPSDPLETGSGTRPDASATSHPEPGDLQPGPRSVLLLTLDTTRVDRLGAYGAAGAETPHLDALARDGVLFERAYAVTPVTLPSHATLLTGLDPPRHGVRNNGIHHLEESFTTLPERLQSAGWRTAAFVSAAVLERRYGLDQGFDTYDDDLTGGGPRGERAMTERPAEITVDAALAWLNGLRSSPGDPSERFFLWVHLFDPHAPYAPPAPYSARFAESPYDGEIAYLDAQIGRLLAHPRLADVLVAAIGDHGEALGEHGEATHGMLVYDATMRVPFMLRVPGGPRGLRVATPVSQVDLVPTLEDLLGLGAPEASSGRPGRSLLPELTGDSSGEDGRSETRVLYGESHVAFHAYGWAKLRAVWRGGVRADDRFDKFIEAPTEELYDLRRDPEESENLLLGKDSGGAATQKLRDELAAALNAWAAEAPERETTLARDREAEARLRSLGYLPTGGRRPAGAPRPDPKDVIGVHEDLQRVGGLLQDRRFAEATRELRSVLARDPENPTALRDLARALAEMGRFDDAVAALERALTLDPSDAALHLALADLEARQGDLERALELTEAALGLDPRSQEARLDRARYLARLGRDEEARGLMTEMIGGKDHEGRPGSSTNNPWVELRHAELVELPSGDLAGAERRLRRVVARDPNLAEGWQLLAEVLERDGRRGEAAEVVREGLRHQPRALELQGRLGRLLAETGDPRAQEVLRRALELAGELGQPAPAGALQNLAALALSQRRWQEAEDWASQAVEADPSLAAAWNGLGIAREEQGRLDAAATAYRRALEADPTYWQAGFNAGLLLGKQRRFREAAAAFEAVLEQVPGHAGAHFQLGMLLAGPLGEPVKARAHLRAALEAEPDHPRAQRIRQALERL